MELQTFLNRVINSVELFILMGEYLLQAKRWVTVVCFYKVAIISIGSVPFLIGAIWIQDMLHYFLLTLPVRYW